MSLFPHAHGIPKRFKAGGANYIRKDGVTTSVQIHEIVVPERKIWQIISCSINAGDASTRAISIYDAEVKYVTVLIEGASGTGAVYGPEQNVADRARGPFLAWEGDYVQFYFGTSQATTKSDYITLYIIEYDLDEIYEQARKALRK